jgi:esterase
MKLHYREFGSGQTFIILHGLFGSSDNWQTHAKKLAEYFHVILVDQRNHGHSCWSEDFSYQHMANDLNELCVDLQLSNFILLGHSMGGKTVMEFAKHHEKLISKLIIVDIGIKSYPMHHEKIITGLKSINLEDLSTRIGAENQLRNYIESNGVLQFLLKNLYWNSEKKLAWRMNIPVLENKMNEILSEILIDNKIYTPTLFIRGELSNYILDEDWTEIENYFPDSKLITIQNAGHWVHAEAPKLFIDEVLNFCLR